MKQLQTLLNNVWIEKCEGPWGSSIVLAAKPHQENIQKVDDFIWIMFVYYRKLNGIIKPFEFPIPRFDNAISTVGAVLNKIWIISLDVRQGYHQISVCRVYREKLAFFAPDNQKYTFLVMPFDPTNATGFYSAMMKNFKDKWIMIFIETLRKIGTLINEQVTVIETDEVFIGDKKLISGSRTIIYNILLLCINLRSILVYLECMQSLSKIPCNLLVGKMLLI